MTNKPNTAHGTIEVLASLFPAAFSVFPRPPQAAEGRHPRGSDSRKRAGVFYDLADVAEVIDVRTHREGEANGKEPQTETEAPALYRSAL